MMDCSQEALEESRPNIHPLEAIDHCLYQLYKDTKHEVADSVVDSLTFEELIGALLLARDGVETLTDNLA